jgi:transposase
MLLGLTTSIHITVCTGFTDGRLGCEGLRGIVTKSLRQDPRSGRLFVFCNKRVNRVKFLWYHDGGFYIAAKRPDRGSIDWPRNAAGAARMSAAQLMALLKGVEFTRPNKGCWR